MTDQEYLQTLDVLEGVGDKGGRTATSSKYGITDKGIERITRNIRMQDGKGNYTQDALALQEQLSPKLKKILLDNITWKNGHLEKWASLDQVSKAGKDVWAELALATRAINKRKINDLGCQPFTEEVQDRICLAAHNRPSLLKNKAVQDAICANNEEVLRHEMLTNMDNVDSMFMPGIRRRMAALFSTDWKDVSVVDKWRSFDKNGREGINTLVDFDYQKDKDFTIKRIKELSDDQAIASKYGQKADMQRKKAKQFPNQDVFVQSLIPTEKDIKVVAEPEGPIAGAKMAQGEVPELTAWERFTNSLRPFLEPLLGKKDKVANLPQNILNNTKGDA